MNRPVFCRLCSVAFNEGDEALATDFKVIWPEPAHTRTEYQHIPGECPDTT